MRQDEMEARSEQIESRTADARRAAPLAGQPAAGTPARAGAAGRRLEVRELAVAEQKSRAGKGAEATPSRTSFGWTVSRRGSRTDRSRWRRGRWRSNASSSRPAARTRDLEEQAAQMDDWHSRLTAEAERLEARKQEQHASDQPARPSGHRPRRASKRCLPHCDAAGAHARRTCAARNRPCSDQRDPARSRRGRHQGAAGGSRTAALGPRQRQAAFRGGTQALRRTSDHFGSGGSQRSPGQGFARRRGRDNTEAPRTSRCDGRRARREGRLADGPGFPAGADAGASSSRSADACASTKHPSHAEQTLATLQEQVRRRSVELDEKQKQTEAGETQLADRVAEARSTAGTARTEPPAGRRGTGPASREVEARAEGLNQLESQLGAKAEMLKTAGQNLEGESLSLNSQRQALTSERLAWEVERQAAAEQDRQARAEFAVARQEAVELTRKMPEMELRAPAALERLSRARENLREHLAEVQTYAAREPRGTRSRAQAGAGRIRSRPPAGGGPARGARGTPRRGRGLPPAADRMAGETGRDPPIPVPG